MNNPTLMMYSQVVGAFVGAGFSPSHADLATEMLVGCCEDNFGDTMEDIARDAFKTLMESDLEQGEEFDVVMAKFAADEESVESVIWALVECLVPLIG